MAQAAVLVAPEKGRGAKVSQKNTHTAQSFFAVHLFFNNDNDVVFPHTQLLQGGHVVVQHGTVAAEVRKNFKNEDDCSWCRSSSRQVSTYTSLISSALPMANSHSMRVLSIRT